MKTRHIKYALIKHKYAMETLSALQTPCEYTGDRDSYKDVDLSLFLLRARMSCKTNSRLVGDRMQ